MELDDDKYLYETVLAVRAAGQTINVQNIIQNFVSSSSSSSHTTVVFRDDDNDDDEDEPSICYFEPNTAPECKPVNGECPNDWPMNEDGNCHPGGECPDGFGRVDDDETGTCYDEDDIVDCDNGAKVLDEDDCAIYDPNPPGDPAQICYFEPNDEVCNPDEDGNCPEGLGHNEDGQCIPHGSCPDGYARLDDDETGRCYAEHATKICPPNNIRVLQSETCPEVPSEPVTEEEEPECEEGFVLENGVCAALDSNCGGVPCTPSQKEDSTTTDHIPGEPHTPTEDSQDESGDEQETEQEQEEEPEEQEESNAEDSEQEN